MCLGIPGRIEKIVRPGGIERSGIVDFGGVKKEISLAYVPEAVIGDYVVVHVGFAISAIDQAEAERVFQYLEEIGELQDMEWQGL